MSALICWGVVVIPALAGWVAAPESSSGWLTAAGTGSGIWFLGHGQTIGGNGARISMVPILLFVAFVAIAARGARRAIAVEHTQVGRRREVDASVWANVVPSFLLGYAAVILFAAMFSLAGPVQPGFFGLAGALVVPVLGLLTAVLSRRDEDSPGPPAFAAGWFRRLPEWVGPAWRAGWRGFWALAVVGLVVALGRVLLSWGEISRINAEIGLGLIPGVVLLLAQFFLLGNAATWALSFFAGPGFQIAAGSVIAPAAAHPGLMPLVPVLGALPKEADYSPAMFVVILVPVIVGAFIGRWVLAIWAEAREADESIDGDEVTSPPLGSRLAAAVVAAGVAVVPIVALTALGRGDVGQERLTSIGPLLWPFAGALLLEVVVGAVIAVLLSALQTSRAGAGESDDSGAATDSDDSDDSADSDAADNDDVDDVVDDLDGDLDDDGIDDADEDDDSSTGRRPGSA